MPRLPYFAVIRSSSSPAETRLRAQTRRFFVGRNEYGQIASGFSAQIYGLLGEASAMNILLIEAILDRYVAKAQKRAKAWSPDEVETLLLKLREEVLDCLK